MESYGHGMLPHPPAEAGDPAILKVHKKKVQRLNEGQQTSSGTKKAVSDVKRDGEDISGGEVSQADATASVSMLEEGMEELAVVDILKSAGGLEQEREEEEGEMDRGSEEDGGGELSNELSPETTYSYSSHPKSAANVKVYNYRGTPLISS